MAKNETALQGVPEASVIPYEQAFSALDRVLRRRASRRCDLPRQISPGVVKRGR